MLSQSTAPPVCKTFVMCRRIMIDQHTKEFLLLAPLYEMYAQTFPMIVEVSFYVRVTCANGTFTFTLQLQDLEGDVVWRDVLEPPLQVSNPLATGILQFMHRRMYVPHAGKYDVLLLANGDEIFRDTLAVHVQARGP